MKKSLLILIMFFSVNGYAQLVPYFPYRTRGISIQDQYLIARYGMGIPATSGATANTPLLDSVGRNFQLLTANGYLSVSKGLGTGTWQYTPKSFNDATYQTLANLSSNLTSSSTKYPSVDAVNAGIAAAISGISTPNLQQVTNIGAVTTANIQVNRLSAGKSNGGEVIESNGSLAAFGSINAHAASRASLGWASSVTQIWSHGANSSTKGGFQFLSRSSDGSLASTPLYILGNDNVGIGITNPLAALHLKGGTSSAGTASFKISAGTLMATPENGAMEYDGTNLYFTPSATTRKTISYVEDEVNTVSSASTLTLGQKGYYSFNGSSATWTLPPITGNTGKRYVIMNLGSGSITINSDSGSNVIYSPSLVNTISVATTEVITLYNNGTYWVRY